MYKNNNRVHRSISIKPNQVSVNEVGLAYVCLINESNKQTSDQLPV